MVKLLHIFASQQSSLVCVIYLVPIYISYCRTSAVFMVLFPPILRHIWNHLC